MRVEQLRQQASDEKAEKIKSRYTGWLPPTEYGEAKLTELA